MNYFNNHKHQRGGSAGFSILEIVIYIAILSIVVLLVSSVVYYFTRYNEQTKGDREVLENARRAMEEITYEMNAAKSIYTPTTTQNQLSLETSKYLPADETTTYIDFFICDLRICLKKEGQTPIYLTGDTVEVDTLEFTQVFVNQSPSVKIDLTMNYKNTINNSQPSVNFTSTISLRNN